MIRILMVAGLVLLLLSGVFVGYVLYVAVPQARPSNQDPLRSLEHRLWRAPEFELLKSDGTEATHEELDGRVWLAAFIFTRCPGPCPLITQRMSEVQQGMSERSDFRLVSFSVDPDHDRPAVLDEYAREWNADTGRWWFLTEDEPGEMLALAREMKIAAERVDSGGEDPPNIIHGTNLLLVDRQGWVRAVFSSEDPDVSDQVIEAAEKLLREPLE